jgi:hypothetical protein
MIQFADFEVTPEPPKFEIEFVSQGKKATQPPNPEYPNGLVITDPTLKPGGLKCQVHLEYPAPCVGTWVVKCNRCGKRVACTAAGRPDDPRVMTIACKLTPEQLDHE